jgi:hypothetical protein
MIERIRRAAARGKYTAVDIPRGGTKAICDSEAGDYQMRRE